MLDARWRDSKRRLSSRIYQSFGGPFEKVSSVVPVAELFPLKFFYGSLIRYAFAISEI